MCVNLQSSCVGVCLLATSQNQRLIFFFPLLCCCKVLLWPPVFIIMFWTNEMLSVVMIVLLFILSRVHCVFLYVNVYESKSPNSYNCCFECWNNIDLQQFVHVFTIFYNDNWKPELYLVCSNETNMDMYEVIWV